MGCALKNEEIQQKYCLAYRQGAIGIETAEIKMRMWHLEKEFEIRQKDQVRCGGDKNQSPTNIDKQLIGKT